MKYFLILSLYLALIPSNAQEAQMVPYDQLVSKWGSQTVEAVTSAAENGDASAQFFLGSAYMKGMIDKRRQPEAGLKWYEKSVAQDFPNAQLNLGIWLFFGEPGQGGDNRKRGLELLRKAAETKNEFAFFYLGSALRLDGNPAEAFENLEAAAKEGVPGAMVELSDMYWYGVIKRDNAEAFKWAKKAADAGDVKGMARLVEILESPDGSKYLTNPDEAKEWRRKAVAKGYHFERDPETMEQMLSRNGIGSPATAKRLAEAQKLEKGSDSEKEQAYRIYLEIADREPDAAFKAGWLYENGKVVPQDDRRALEYYTRSYDSIPTFNPKNLAEKDEAILRLLEAGRGLGSPQENQRFVSVLRSRAFERPAGISYRVGRLYDEGKIIPADLTAAVRYYRESAALGSAEARNRLGELWAEGVDTKPDPTEAAQWFRAAALQGYAPAEFNLAKAFASGAGVEKDSIIAFRLLTLASQKGELNAKIELNKLKLTPAEQNQIDQLKKTGGLDELPQAWLKSIPK